MSAVEEKNIVAQLKHRLQLEAIGSKFAEEDMTARRRPGNQVTPVRSKFLFENLRFSFPCVVCTLNLFHLPLISDNKGSSASKHCSRSIEHARARSFLVFGYKAIVFVLMRVKNPTYHWM
jgi:hypothetical protein